MPAPIDVVVRCKNEMPHVERTLAALARIDGIRVLFIDSGSTDGSRERAKAAGVEVIAIAPESYVPGRVLNDAMKRTTSAIVAFVNADAVPLDDGAVEKLVAACRAGAAASFGRQLPRRDARPLTVLDHERAFPAGPHDAKLADFFSMAASAIRRDVWEAIAFDESLRYSEDVDWTSRLRALGFRVEYVPGARFEHSHDYDARSMRRRMRGEGDATARIDRVAGASRWRDFVRPLVGRLARDARAGTISPSIARLRWEAARGRFEGLASAIDAKSDARHREADRFTLHGRAEDEALVASVLDEARRRIDAAFGARAIAAILVGSFAAGEGVVRESDGARRIEGDVDLAIVVESPAAARRARAACTRIAADVSSTTGAHVDLWPVARADLASPRGRMLWIDAAVRGARVVAGARDVLALLDGLGPRAIARDELGRLLANRATGLALSRLAADRGEHDPATAARHVAKAWIAAGDALLVTIDRYAPSLDARRDRLRALARAGSPIAASVIDGYEWALAARAAGAGAHVTVDELEDHADRLWRAHARLEASRARDVSTSTPDEYATSDAPLYPSLPDVPLGGRWFAGGRAAARRLVAWSHASRHPREALARASVLLAYGRDRRAARTWAARALCATSASARDVEHALVALRDVAA